MKLLKKAHLESTNPKIEKRDILSEMFEDFGIKVVDVTNQNSRPRKKKKLK